MEASLTLLLLLVSAAAFVAPGLCGAPKECPPVGELGFAHESSCDLYYRCTNGTLTEEQCPNGLLFVAYQSVHDFCNYIWAAPCADKELIPAPESSPGCEYQFGVYSLGSCTQYAVCEWGQPLVKDCEPGLAYMDKIHKCTWPDEVPECDSEEVVGFKCPERISGKASKFYPFPRYPYPADCTRLITCVKGKPRLIGCGHGSAFNTDTDTCDDIRNVPTCKPPYLLKEE